MKTLWIQYVPDSMQEKAQCLVALSPYFAALMDSASQFECQKIFRNMQYSCLPKHDSCWFPKNESDKVDDCMKHLRHLKQQAMRYIVWWELGLHGDIEVSYHAITHVAEALLEQAIIMAKRLIYPRFGSLKGGEFCIIGLGKLGGRELNLGSDVDPLFLWQGEGLSQGGRTSVRANEYYNHLSRMIIKLLSEYTKHGMAWVVDMRLRPGGDGSPICLSLDASLSHYLEYGQTWERAMLIKARPVAGDLNLGRTFIQHVRPFVYRRYLDYSTVTALADMKRRIDQQGGEHQLVEGFDVKRGKGGIREVEFIIQSMQLLHAGRHSLLQCCEGKLALKQLCQHNLMDAEESQKLFEAYTFWRRIEHALQARKGEQTHALGSDFSDYLGKILNIDDITHLMHQHQNYVFTVFTQRLLPIAEKEDEMSHWLNGAPLLSGNKKTTLETQQQIQQVLHRIDKQLRRGLLPERSRQQVESILYIAMPIWLNDSHGTQALEAFSDLLHQIGGRATWIDLLATEKGVLQWLIGVLSASRYLAEHIVKNPSWLEWPLSSVQQKHDLNDLCQSIDDLDGADECEFLADLGRFIDQGRACCALHIDAHTMDVQMIGVWLAKLADAAVRACLRSSLQQLKLPLDFPLLALALGKHGSREMGLVSDLDMVFVLAGNPDTQIHDRSNREWAQRLGRRLIRQLSDSPPYGAGYMFDARLRPSGNSGVLVTTLKGFQDYQQHEAQTWEHQALCRARVITGTQTHQHELETMLIDIIAMPRETEHIRFDILTMRQKILQHLSSQSSLYFNLKHDAGGLIDIEFLAQYARLTWGGEHTGTVQSLLHLHGKAPKNWQESAPILAATYRDYRQMENALRVELWQSIGKLPRDPQATEWETMHRHAAIQSPNLLSQRMQETHFMFQALLNMPKTYSSAIVEQSS